MRKFLLFAFMVLISYIAQAQRCYDPSRTVAMMTFKEKQFVEAKKIFVAMKDCPDKPEKEDIEFWIGKCDEAQDPVKRPMVISLAEKMKRYEECSVFSEGMLAVQKIEDIDRLNSLMEMTEIADDDYMYFERDNAPRIGFINEKGDLVIPCAYEDPIYYHFFNGFDFLPDCRFSDGLAAVIKKFSGNETNNQGAFCGESLDGTPFCWGWGYIDKKGNEVIPFNFVDAHGFSEGLASVIADDDFLWQFIDKKGKIVITQKFEYASDFSDGMCLVKPDSLSKGYGYIDRTGKLVVPAIYPGGTPFKDGIAAVGSFEHEFETALINKSGEMVGDYTFRPEYLSMTQIKQYAVDMFNEENYNKCHMALLAHEKKRVEEHREENFNTLGILPYIQGRIYYDGLGGYDKNYEKAFKAFCRGEESNALYMQAICYYYGHGVEKNYQKAFELYDAAVKNNNWDGHGYYNLSTGKTEHVLKRHITKGQGLYSLGLMYYYGRGTNVDYQRALDLFVQSDKEGYDKAEQMITKMKYEEKVPEEIREKARLANPTELDTCPVFTIASDKRVVFSQGNLQYQASTRTWRFAEHQWDYIGGSNEKISKRNKGWIDLFGWGTGNNPTNTSFKAREYYTFNDWGDNTIVNGEGKSWRTLTQDEWSYMLNTRRTYSNIRFAKAIVNNVNGVVLLPDNWNISNYYLSDANKSNASFSSNCISYDDWMSKFEVNGAVFLPAAGARAEVKGYERHAIILGGTSCYWVAPKNSQYDLWFGGIEEQCMCFGDLLFVFEKQYCCWGASVRLVYDFEKK